jgi:TonB family protein
MYDVKEFYEGTTIRHFFAKYTTDAPPYNIEHFADSMVFVYAKSGFMLETRNYSNGKRHGRQIEFYLHSYNIKSFKAYKEGVHTGYDTSFYKIGTPIIEYINEYKNDSLISSKHYEVKDSIRANYKKKDSSVVKPPKFKRNLKRYLRWKTNYPRKLRAKSIQGEVLLGFVINIDGTIGDISVLKAAEEGFVREAIRVIKKMPRWIPAEKNNKPIKFFYTIPFIFIFVN